MYLDHARATGDVSAYIEEMFGSQKVVKAFSYEDRALIGFDIVNEDLANSGKMSPYQLSPRTELNIDVIREFCSYWDIDFNLLTNK